jgi:hypothetical protein
MEPASTVLAKLKLADRSKGTILSQVGLFGRATYAGLYSVRIEASASCRTSHAQRAGATLNIV